MATKAQKATTQSESPQQQTLPMQYDVRIHSLRLDGNCRAHASVNINGCFAVRGVKVMESSRGLFVSMPSYKVGNDYKDICFPITPECRKQLNDAVLGAYEQALTQSQNSVAKHHEMQQAPEGQAMDMTGM